MKGMVRSFGSLFPYSGNHSLSWSHLLTPFICIEAELSKRISEDNLENLHLPQNTVILLKKELSQKTEALNKALQRESELKVS